MVVLQNRSVLTRLVFQRSAVGRVFPMKGSRKANAFFSQTIHSNDEINDDDVCHLHRRWLRRNRIQKRKMRLSESSPLVRPPDEPTPALPQIPDLPADAVRTIAPTNKEIS